MSIDTSDRLAALAPDQEVMRARTDRLRPQVLALATTSRSRPPRRRLTLLAAGVAAALVATVVVGTTMFLDRATPAQDAYEDATPAAAYETYGAFSIGSTLFIGNREVRFDEKVKSLYYTSEGVLVRSGKSNAADDEGPSHFTLVSADGSRRAVYVTMKDRVPATDPTSPYLAYAAPAGSEDRWDLVRIDLRDPTYVVNGDKESPLYCTSCHNFVGRGTGTTVSGAFTWGGWEAPPVAMSGDRVWVLLDPGWTEWDVATGEVRRVARPDGLLTPLAAGGTRYVVTTPDGSGSSLGRDAVRDFITGETVAQIPFSTSTSMPAPATADLSPEGGFARYDEQGSVYGTGGRLLEASKGAKILDLATGRKTPLESGEWGWSPDGHAVQVQPDKNRVIVCDGSTGRCETIERDLPSGTVRIGGRYYGT